MRAGPGQIRWPAPQRHPGARARRGPARRGPCSNGWPRTPARIVRDAARWALESSVTSRPMSLPLLAVAGHRRARPGLPLLRRLRGPAVPAGRRGGHARPRGTTTASTSCPPGRSTCCPSTSRPSPRRDPSPDRSSPASSSAGCPRCCGSASAWCSSARSTTSPPWSPRSATTAARSPRWCKANLGQRAYLAMMAFIWVALVYVILAFTDVTASTFVSGDADMQRARPSASTRAARWRPPRCSIWAWPC